MRPKRAKKKTCVSAKRKSKTQPKRIANAAKRERAVELLARGFSERKTATEIRCSRNTLARWRTEQTFTEQVEGRRTELLSDWRGAFSQLVPTAIKTLFAAMNEGGAPAVRAAIAILKTHGVARRYEGALDELGDHGVVEIEWAKLDDNEALSDAP